MKVTLRAILAALVAPLAFGAYVPRNRDAKLRSLLRRDDVPTDLDEAARQFTELVGAITEQKLASLNSTGGSSCHAGNIAYRKEYGDLSKAERADYIKAVECLMRLPARTPAEVAPGAKSRFDDFVVTHIQQTFTAHYTGNFMAWHRWYVWQYEKALRDECGYKGYQPYWDWAKYAAAPQDSPIFNGDPWSLGGNGEWDPDVPNSIITLPEGVTGDDITLPRGLGGGFVTNGPFSNMTINLGPVGAVYRTNPNPQPDGLGYNPRKLKRDISPGINTRYANYSTVLNLFHKANIKEYRLLSEGEFDTGEIGPHGGGHYTVNGDPEGDFWTAPADPMFYVHHGQMDRMWTIWQVIDPETRGVDLDAGPYGHLTWNNEPESPLASLDDVIDMGYAAPSTTIRHVMSTTGGDFCYFYA